jgi:F-type H+-transporting ATPase subunit delta
MRNTKAAIRYAKSLLELALEQNKLDKCFEDMKMIQKVLDQSNELRSVLRSPVIGQAKKDKILKELFGENVDILTMSFLNIVGEKGRDSLLPEIISAFVDQVKRHKQIMVAKVVSAAPLSEELRQKIRKIISEVHNGELELIEVVDEDIIGGFILNIADKRIDASIRGQIRELRKEFSENPYEPKL